MCKKENHFAGSKACQSTGDVRSIDEENTYQFDATSQEYVSRIETIRRSAELRERSSDQQTPSENVCRLWLRANAAAMENACN